ncbi:MAG: hypothetical protein GY845_21465 [Planctomycetes bacterium]|nr:hypothetical protein [Planctomycetota bacterium]
MFTSNHQTKLTPATAIAQTFDIDLKGQTPTAAMFTLTLADTWNTDESNAAIGVGLTDGTNQYAMAAYDENGQDPTNNGRATIDDGCILLTDPDSATVRIEAAITSFSANQVTVTYSTVNATQVYVTCKAWAGTTGAIVQEQAFKGSTGDVAVSGLGINPNCIIAGTVGTAFPDSSSLHFKFSIGMACYNGSSTKHACQVMFSDDNDSGADVQGTMYNTYFSAMYTNTTGINSAIKIKSWDTGGFTFTQDLGDNSHEFMYLAMEIPGDLCDIIDIDFPNSDSRIDYSGAAFRPRSAICLGSTVPDYNTDYDDGKMGGVNIGFMSDDAAPVYLNDDYGQVTHFTTHEDGSDRTRSGTYDTFVRIREHDGSMFYEGILDNFNSDGVNVKFEDTHSNTHRGFLLLFGSEQRAAENFESGIQLKQLIDADAVQDYSSPGMSGSPTTAMIIGQQTKWPLTGFGTIRQAIGFLDGTREGGGSCTARWVNPIQCYNKQYTADAIQRRPMDSKDYLAHNAFYSGGWQGDLTNHAGYYKIAIALMLRGSDIANYETDNAAITTAADSEETITLNTSFAPDVIIFRSVGTTVADGTGDEPHDSWGMVVNDGSLTQRAWVCRWDKDGETLPDFGSILHSDRVGGALDNASPAANSYELECTDISTGSFGITPRVASAGSNELQYWAIKLNNKEARLIDLDAPTSTGTYTSPDIGGALKLALETWTMHTAWDTLATDQKAASMCISLFNDINEKVSVSWQSKTGERRQVSLLAKAVNQRRWPTDYLANGASATNGFNTGENLITIGATTYSVDYLGVNSTTRKGWGLYFVDPVETGGIGGLVNAGLVNEGLVNSGLVN